MKLSMYLSAALIALCCVVATGPAHTQTATGAGRAARPSSPASMRLKHRRVSAPVQANTEAALAERMNANTVSVISGTPGGTYFRMASDMAFVLDDGDNFRVLPILGKGAGQNAYDIRFLKGVDLGFVRTDTLQQLREDKRVTNIERHIAYVARLFNDELHVITSKDVTDIDQLNGKKVSFDVKGSGTDYTGRAMFEGLGLEVEVVNVDQLAALELLKRGEIAAVVSVAAKPVAVVSNFDGEGRFHLLQGRYADALADRYFPASLTHKDYPKLIPDGTTIDTLAVGTILAAYNWPEASDRYGRIARFVDAFFSKFDSFLAPTRHPKWREVNLGAEVPGWTRFTAAQKWLETHRDGPATTSANREEFKRFLDDRKPSVDADRDRLFQEFLEWSRIRQDARKVSRP